MEITFIGVGRLGGALALALSQKGYSIRNLISRNIENAEKIAAKILPQPEIAMQPESEFISRSEIIFITTQDSEIETVAKDLSKIISPSKKPFVFHTSGSLSSEVLSNIKKIGCRVGSIHPLVSVSDSFLGAERFRDVYFCLEGDAEARAVAEKIVSDLQGNSFSIETKFKTLYHASAVMASGHVTALIDAAIEMLSACGLAQESAQQVLMPLVKSTIANLTDQTPSKALTGTFARADLRTMNRHLSAIKDNVSAELLEIYVMLGLRSLELAKKQGAAAANLDLMKKILNQEIKARKENE